MTPTEIREARATLGEAWGFGRPLRAAEFGRVLGLTGRDPGRYVLDYESGRHQISGPVALAVSLMLAGAKPADLEQRLER